MFDTAAAVFVRALYALFLISCVLCGPFFCCCCCCFFGGGGYLCVKMCVCVCVCVCFWLSVCLLVSAWQQNRHIGGGCDVLWSGEGGTRQKWEASTSQGHWRWNDLSCSCCQGLELALMYEFTVRRECVCMCVCVCVCDGIWLMLLSTSRWWNHSVPHRFALQHLPPPPDPPSQRVMKTRSTTAAPLNHKHTARGVVYNNYKLLINKPEDSSRPEEDCSLPLYSTEAQVHGRLPWYVKASALN